MGYHYTLDDIEYRYPTRLELLKHWKTIDRWCRFLVPDPNSRFRMGWLDRPHEFILAFIDGELAGVAHIELCRHSADCHIVVDQEHHRTNLGYLLGVEGLKRAFVDFRKPKAYCSIGSDNRPARMLAGALGFRRVACYNKRITFCMTWPDYQQRHGGMSTQAETAQ